MKFYTNVQQWGNNLLVRGVNDDGQRVMQRYKDFSPTLFLKSQNPTQFKTIEGDYVEDFKPGSIKEARQFLEDYKDVSNFKVYGQTQFLYQWISDNFYEQEEIAFDTKQISVISLDIETETEYGFPNIQTANEGILLITIQDNLTKKLITWGTREYHGKNTEVEYRYFDSEAKMLKDFIAWLNEFKPDVITGWNMQLYDIPYIARRIQRVLGEKLMKRLSPWGLVSEGETFIKGRKHITFDVGGVCQLDYLDLYKKFTYKAQESYRLDYIAQVELGQKKLDHSEFDTFKDFYTKGWQKYIEYNIIDVELVDRLEGKMKLIELALTMAYEA